MAVVALVVAWLLAPASLPEGQCSGLGFGCVLTPRDSILQFMGLLFGVPATIVWFSVGAIATSLLSRFTNLRWWWIGLVSLGVCRLMAAVTVKTVERLI